MDELVRYLLNQAEQSECNKDDSFEAMFPHFERKQVPQVFFREAASYFRLVAILSKSQDQDSSEIFTSSITITKEEQEEVSSRSFMSICTA